MGFRVGYQADCKWVVSGIFVFVAIKYSSRPPERYQLSHACLLGARPLGSPTPFFTPEPAPFGDGQAGSLVSCHNVLSVRSLLKPKTQRVPFRDATRNLSPFKMLPTVAAMSCADVKEEKSSQRPAGRQATRKHRPRSAATAIEQDSEPASKQGSPV